MKENEIKEEKKTEEEKNFLKRCWTMIKKDSVTIVFSALLSAISCAVTIWYSTYDRKIKITEIPVGFAPFQVNERGELEDFFISQFKPANEYLRISKNQYRFYPRISDIGGYVGVLKELKDKNCTELRVAYISPSLYILLDNGMLSDYNKERDFSLIGFKRSKNKRIYRTRMIWNKGNKFIEEKINNDEYNNIDFILGSDEYSTSTHVLPEVYLLEHGINLKQKKHSSLNRKEMIDTIKNNSISNFVGFLSNEDFERIGIDTSSFSWKDIGMPLTFDAVLANKKWWKEIKNDSIDIQKALNKTNFAIESSESVGNEMDMLSLYLFSGVIFNENKVQLPDKRFDIFKLREMKNNHRDTVIIFKTNPTNINTQSYNTIDTIQIGIGKLEYKKGEYQIIPFLDSLNVENVKLEGSHVFPKNYKKESQKQFKCRKCQIRRKSCIL